jgi:hypothetical protein
MRFSDAEESILMLFIGGSEQALGESSVDDALGKIAKIQSDIEENNRMTAANDVEIDKLVKSNKRSDSKRLMKLKDNQIILLRALVKLQAQMQQQQLKDKDDTFLLIQEGRFRSGG